MLRLASAMLRTAWLPGLVTVALCVLLSFVLAGWTGSVSALLGGVVAFGSSLLTLWLMRFSAGMNPAAVMGMCLGGYIIKMLVLMLVMTLLGGLALVQREALAFTMLAAVLVWAGAEIVAFRKTPIPTIIPAE
ncbi:hypothetical protein [Bounagaea algeriensis]